MNPDSHSDLVSIGLIGIAGYAQNHVDLLMEPDIRRTTRLAAVTVLPSHHHLESVGKLRERGARIFSTYESMLAPEGATLDLCIIPTGIHWHRPMATTALRAGANILVEKPLAGCLGDAESIRDCERETGRWAAVGFQDFYTDTVKWLKGELVSGTIGALRSIKVIGLWPRSDAYYLRNDWAGRLYLDDAAVFDSPLNNAFAHFVNLALFLAAPDEHCSANVEIVEAELFRTRDIESFDTAVVRARSASGVDIAFGVSHACELHRAPEIHVIGESGHARWIHAQECMVAPRGKPPLIKPVPDSANARRKMLRDVLARFNDSASRICGTDIALQHVRFIDGLHRQTRIKTLDQSFVRRRKPNGSGEPVSVIPGIEYFLDLAVHRGCSLHEAGFRPVLADASSSRT